MKKMNLKYALTAATAAVALPGIAFAQQEQSDTQQQQSQTQQQQSSTQQEATTQDQGVNIVTLPEWQADYDALYTGTSVDELLDADVQGPTGDDIGEIENVVFSEGGQVLSVIAEVGGFAEIGDTHVDVPWDQVEVAADGDSVTIPVTQETVEDFSLFPDGMLTLSEASTDIEAVQGDNLGQVLTGPRVWKAREIIGDYARLRAGDGFANYGYVDDLIIRDGELAAVVVSPDVTWGAPGLYAYPYYGYGYGWAPGLAYYDLPYDQEDVGVMQPLDYERFDD